MQIISNSLNYAHNPYHKLQLHKFSPPLLSSFISVVPHCLASLLVAFLHQMRNMNCLHYLQDVLLVLTLKVEVKLQCAQVLAGT